MKRESNTNPKKKWAKPKLIVLTRGRLGEGVLLPCKTGSGFGPGGPLQVERMCTQGLGFPCMADCSAQAAT
jgi:hypothetical protein